VTNVTHLKYSICHDLQGISPYSYFIASGSRVDLLLVIVDDNGKSKAAFSRTLKFKLLYLYPKVDFVCSRVLIHTYGKTKEHTHHTSFKFVNEKKFNLNQKITLKIKLNYK